MIDPAIHQRCLDPVRAFLALQDIELPGMAGRIEAGVD